MGLEELMFKQELLNVSKEQLLMLASKYDNKEEFTESEIEYLIVVASSLAGIIQEELLDPAHEKLSGEGPVH